MLLWQELLHFFIVEGSKNFISFYFSFYFDGLIFFYVGEMLVLAGDFYITVDSSIKLTVYLFLSSKITGLLFYAIICFLILFSLSLVPDVEFIICWVVYTGTIRSFLEFVSFFINSLLVLFYTWDFIVLKSYKFDEVPVDIPTPIDFLPWLINCLLVIGLIYYFSVCTYISFELLELSLNLRPDLRILKNYQ